MGKARKRNWIEWRRSDLVPANSRGDRGNEGGVTENAKGCKSQRTADVQGSTRPELGGDSCAVRVT